MRSNAPTLMDARRLAPLALLIAAGAATWAFAQPGAPTPAPTPHAQPADEPDEETIDLAKAPEAVRAAAVKLAGDAKNITRVIKEEDDHDVTTYEIEFKEGGAESAAVFSAAGDLMELEKSIPAAKLPAAVTAALAKRFPGAAIQRPMSVTRMFYEVHVTIDGKPREIKVDPSGAIADHADAKHEDQDKDEKKPAAAGAPADPTDDFRKTFAVEKSALGPTGASRYFDLTPGVVSTFKDGKTTLAITVLNETRVLDGVTTRVVEEREEVAGKPKETSRNYFAIDKASSDVYYFGEDVDEFDADGKATHPGAWHAGENGARFGLMIPGAPKVGDKFYQELAPGLAMDRFEIVGVEDTIQTPAGKFEHCVHVVETTPLEKDVGHKWYAPGTGLVKDGNAELVSIKRPGK